MLSVAIITFNEEENIGRTLRSVAALADEIVVVDSGSTDRTLEIARSFGPKVRIFVETWRGFAPQKNLSIEKTLGDWVLSLDADEVVSAELAAEIAALIAAGDSSGQALIAGSIPRKNLFLGGWIKHGGGYPDRKIRLFPRGRLRFGERRVHEDIKIPEEERARGARVVVMKAPLIHHTYPTLTGYIEHMNRYSSLGGEILMEKRRTQFSVLHIVITPVVRFFYNYVLRGGFLDGREGLLFHLYHSVYISWKYAKAWELGRHQANTKEGSI